MFLVLIDMSWYNIYCLTNIYIYIYQTLCIGNHAIDDKIDEDIQTFKKCIIKTNIKEFIA